MKSTRQLSLFALGLVIGFGLTACGSGDETRPIPTSDVIDMGEGSSPTPSPTPTPEDTVPPGMDPDDVPISPETRDRLARIALDEVGGGRVDDIERSDESTHAYEVEVELHDDDVTVEISEDFRVVDVDR